jgi:hypothetical protein
MRSNEDLKGDGIDDLVLGGARDAWISYGSVGIAAMATPVQVPIPSTAIATGIHDFAIGNAGELAAATTRMQDVPPGGPTLALEHLRPRRLRERHRVRAGAESKHNADPRLSYEPTGGPQSSLWRAGVQRRIGKALLDDDIRSGERHLLKECADPVEIQRERLMP